MSENTQASAETVKKVAEKSIDAAVVATDAMIKPLEAAVSAIPAAGEMVSNQAAKAVELATKTASAKVSAATKTGRTKTSRVAEAVRKPVRSSTAKLAKRKYVRKAVNAVKDKAATVFHAEASKSQANPFIQGTKIMDTNNWFAGFTSVPGAEKFQNLFADAGEKGQQVARKGQALAETMSETARANLEAVVEFDADRSGRRP